MDEGQRVGDFLERPAYQLQIKPRAGQPRGQVGEQRAADAAHLLDVHHAAAQQSHGDEKQRDRQHEQHRVQDVHRDMQPQNGGHGVADDALGQRDGQNGQQIAQNEVRRRQRRGVESRQKGALLVLCDQRRGKKRQKRKAEHGDAGGKVLDLKQAHRDVGLNGGQKQQQNHRKADAEAQIQRVPQNLLCRPAGKCEQPHVVSPFTMATNASSNLSFPAARFSSSAVPTMSSFPALMMPMRSERASASSM